MKFPVLWLSFSLAKCGRLGVMLLKRLVVYEAKYAKKQPQVKKEPCRVLDDVDVDVLPLKDDKIENLSSSAHVVYNCKTGHFTSWKERERLRNVQK